MPEGPEVWFLSRLLQTVPGNTAVSCHGKCLFVGKVTMHFGLESGVECKVCPDTGVVVTTFNKRGITGHATEGEHMRLGIDWMTSTPAKLHEIVMKNALRAVKLGSWMLDQTAIAGVGVAWASEIAHEAGLDVNKPMRVQNVSKLAEAYVKVREGVKTVYEQELRKAIGKEIEIANAWFRNLYDARLLHGLLKVYKCGTPVSVGSRVFWK